MSTKNKYLDIFKKYANKIMGEINSGQSLSKTAAKYNVSRECLARYLEKNCGYTRRKRQIIHSGEITMDILKYAKEEYVKGERSVSNIADQYNVPRKKLSKMLKAEGVNIRSDGRKKVNEHYFDNIDTPEKAYWLGFFFADGYNSGSPRNCIEFSLKESDKESVENFRDALKSSCSILQKDICLNGKYFRSYRLIIRNKCLSDALMKYGRGIKKAVEKMPILQYDLVHHFIRGLFDGDGCLSVYNRKRNNGTHYQYLSLNITFCNKNFLTQILKHLENNVNGFKGHINENRPGVFALTAAKASTELFCKYIYQDSTESTRLRRKYLLYKQYCRPEINVA